MVIDAFLGCMEQSLYAIALEGVFKGAKSDPWETLNLFVDLINFIMEIVPESVPVVYCEQHFIWQDFMIEVKRYFNSVRRNIVVQFFLEINDKKMPCYISHIVFNYVGVDFHVL